MGEARLRWYEAKGMGLGFGWGMRDGVGTAEPTPRAGPGVLGQSQAPRKGKGKAASCDDDDDETPNWGFTCSYFASPPAAPDPSAINDVSGSERRYSSRLAPA
ncbi:hypothetical protein AXG93_3846s1080 [Marchantia polymorpha subsp. ruderalis]|uniref:Uncharacterized protein n=1 Tax=Marchantia polymorpha subsp. ruderalis TaxID=1480154 RepID=A0A176VJ98_MARPO|nr:hypothetical protein AXG93_3846s1080 [Marchantia polymorpha subsp. ruderalis]